MIIAYIILIIFIIMGIALFFGKASWLIAGYNTASKEEKEKVDEKKLCRSMGVMMLVVSAIIGALIYVNTDEFAVNMSIVLILVVIVEMIYANKYCKKK